MSEIATNTPRLMAAAKEFNIGKDTLIDLLVAKGFNSDDLKPTAKLTEDMYRILQQEFQQDKVAKQNAEKIELNKTAVPAEPKKKKDEEDLSFKKKETPAPPAPVAEKPVPEAEVKIPLQAETAENKKEVARGNNGLDIVKIEAPLKPCTEVCHAQQSKEVARNLSAIPNGCGTSATLVFLKNSKEVFAF